MKATQIIVLRAAGFFASSGSAIALDSDSAFALPQQSVAPATQDGMDHLRSHRGHGCNHRATSAGVHGMSNSENVEAREQVRENMVTMAITMPAMEAGMAKADTDVAFACGMIAHHQAAVDMA